MRPYSHAEAGDETANRSMRLVLESAVFGRRWRQLSIELEDAQRHYTYDDAAYADALYGYSIAKAAVDRATGRSLASR